MDRQASPSFRRHVIGVLAASVAVAVSAQTHEPQALPAAGSGDGPPSAQLIKTGLYLISGGGGNSLLRFSAHGLILVDGKLPGSYRPLMSQVRRIAKISDLPVRVLVVTDHRANHTGNNAQFLAAGVPIIAQENAKRHWLAEDSSAGPPAPPIITYDRSYTLRLGGVEVQLMHFGSAQTNDAAVVYFPDLKVIDVGDLFTPGTPEADFTGGGSLVGWGPVLGQVLKLDFDVVVPSTGPVVTRAELESFKTKIETLVSRATALVKKGVAKNQLMAQLKTDDLGWHLTLTGDQLDGFYADLSQAR